MPPRFRDLERSRRHGAALHYIEDFAARGNLGAMLPLADHLYDRGVFQTDWRWVERIHEAAAGGNGVCDGFPGTCE